MKRKKKSSRRKGEGGVPRALGAAAWLVQVLFPLLLKGPVLFSLVVGAYFIMLDRFAAAARRDPRFVVEGEAVRCLSRPAWLAPSERLTSAVVGEIAAAIRARHPAMYIFDDGLEREIRTDPASFSPWIEKVESFERVYPSRLRVLFKLRRPVALFRYRQEAWFIDGKGVVVAPLSDLDQGRIAVGVPEITRFGRAGAVVCGRVASNPALVEGAAVAREIAVLDALDLPPELRITEIDVSRYEEGKPFRPDAVVLYTRGDVPILWGRSARHLEFRGIDPSPEKKALNLKRVLLKRPGLRGVLEVNLTQDRPYIRLEEE